jgi:hypothetical protein
MLYEMVAQSETRGGEKGCSIELMVEGRLGVLR